MALRKFVNENTPDRYKKVAEEKIKEYNREDLSNFEVYDPVFFIHKKFPYNKEAPNFINYYNINQAHNKKITDFVHGLVNIDVTNQLLDGVIFVADLRGIDILKLLLNSRYYTWRYNRGRKQAQKLDNSHKKSGF